MISLSFQTYEKLILLLNQIPYIVDTYEKKNLLFTSMVKEWLKQNEVVLKKISSPLAAECASLRLRILASERGINKNEKVTGYTAKRKLVDGTAIQSLHQAQQSIQKTIDNSIYNFIQAENLVRQILVKASKLGILNGRIQNNFQPSDIVSLWKELLSNNETASLATSVLEVVNYGDAILILNSFILELRREQEKNHTSQEIPN